MPSAPSAVYTINSITQLTPGIEIYELDGTIIDGSGNYSALDFGVGDLIFDASVYGSFRWKITQLLTPAVPGSNLHVVVQWDDEGTPPVADNGPGAGQGAACKACPGKYGVAMAPSVSLNQAYGYGETTYNAIQNSNDRFTDLGLLSFTGGGGGGTGNLIKQMQSGHGSTIPAGKPVSKLANGKIVPADSDDALGQKYVGITKDSITANGTGDVYLTGNNIPGAVSGLGFTPGDEVFLSETSGAFTNNPNSFTNNDDSIIKLGIADCAAGTASSTATDLIMFTEVIARP